MIFQAKLSNLYYMNKTQNLVFFGLVGCGKGTQIQLLMSFLKDKYATDSIHAYPGNAYRRHIQGNTEVGKLVKASMDRGELQPDFLTNAIFVNILIENLNPEINLIADGYPRTIDQSSNFLAQMKFFDRKDVKIIYITLSEEEAMKRNLARGRADDTKEGLKRRFDEYKNNVVPAMNFLKEKGIEVIEVNGEQSIEAVHADILKALNLNN